MTLLGKKDGDGGDTIIQEVQSVVKNWQALAKKLSIPSREINMMQGAFKVADNN